MSGHKRTLICINPALYRQMHEKEMRERFLTGSWKTERVNEDRSAQKPQAEIDLSTAGKRKGLLNLALSLSDPFRLVDTEKTLTSIRKGDGESRNDLAAQKSVHRTNRSRVPDVRYRPLTANQERDEDPELSFPPTYYEEALPDDLGEYAEQDNPADEDEKPIGPDLISMEVDESREEERGMALSALGDLVKEAMGWQACEAIDFNGQPTGIEIDVDEWTSGGLKQYIETLLTLKHQWEEAYSHLEDPHHWIIQDYPLLRQQLEELTFQARMNVLQSQLRINAADRAAKALAEQGYRLQEAGYQDADLREAFTCTLMHPDGSQVQVRVDPPPHPSSQQALHIFSLDAASRTRHELARRSMEIKNALCRNGISSGLWVDEPGVIHTGMPNRHYEEIGSYQDRDRPSISLPVHPVMEEYEDR